LGQPDELFGAAKKKLDLEARVGTRHIPHIEIKIPLPPPTLLQKRSRESFKPSLPQRQKTIPLTHRLSPGHQLKQVGSFLIPAKVYGLLVAQQVDHHGHLLKV